jgi:hypothetical protein
MTKNNKCVVILSHSSYCDIWEMMMLSYNKYFSEKDSFDFFISTNKVSNKLKELANENNFKLITYQENLTWGASLKQTISYLLNNNYVYSLFSFDDLILTYPVKSSVLNLTYQMQEYNIHYLQIKNGYRSWFSNSKLLNNGLHKVDSDDSYKGSLVFSILDEVLLRFIYEIEELEDYNPWQYEINIHKFLANFEFYCLPKSIVTFSNTIIKGKFDPIQLWFSEKRNQTKYSDKREKMNIYFFLKFLIKVLFFRFGKNILPKSLFNKIRVLKYKL